MLVTIEWPVLIFGAIGAVSLWRRWPIFAAFLVWDFVVSLVVYSWAGEKFAWLVLHPLLPLVLLAGVGHRRRSGRRAARCAGVGIAVVVVGALLRRRLLVVGQRRPRRRPARDARLHAVLRRRSRTSPTRCSRWPTSRGPGAPPLTVTVDSAEGATFPYAWYFRHLADRLHRPPAGQRRAADHRRASC